MVASKHLRKAQAGMLGFTPYKVVDSRLLGFGDVTNVSTVISSGAGLVATAAGTAATLISGGGGAAALIAAGSVAQALPVIGTIAGAVAIAAGFVAKAFGKAKAIKEGRREIDAQNNELQSYSYEVDAMISELNSKRAQVYQELNKLGIKVTPMNGIGDFLKKAFTPGKVEDAKLSDSTAQNKKLTNEINTKIATLESLESEFKNLYVQLTQGRAKAEADDKVKKVLIWTGASLATAGLGYLAYAYFSNQK